MFIVTRDIDGFVNPLDVFDPREGHNAQVFKTRAETEDFLANVDNPLDWEVFVKMPVKITF